jgi:ligand-binding SRPBCC domain-containing protein
MYQLRFEQKIPTNIENVWNFISDPRNLKKITPSYMGFQITNEPIAEKMYAGMIIAYKVTPLLSIPMQWVTEITHVQEMEYFVDEQRIGPYTLWHHQHRISEIEGGTLMQDIVSYKPPFGPLGILANSLIIESQLKSIFEYRFQAVVREFGVFSS